METFVYLNGKFIDRVSDKPERMAESLNARIVAVKEFKHPICGKSWRVELERK